MTGRHTVDLNADIGEGDAATDAALLGIVSSGNIACGGHAGDTVSMRHTVALARARGVAIGGHPSYPDREGFGRRAIALGPEPLAAALRGQLTALAAVVVAAGARLAHVKPHGALYNRAAVDDDVATVVADTVRAFDPRLILVGLSGSALVRAGQRAGLATASEVFADRGYESDGTLIPRDRPGALLDDPPTVAARAVRMVTAGLVTAADGHDIPIRADTICIHGDAPHAVALARAVRTALAAAGITIAARESEL